ncbi:uncharacterized protein LOC117116792 [Anneissia japonica]|uniref:uncharacterized protein LOC117116792 n=1 Tax=Anneissia japonica TaxID=1529436 RepID=UPI001425948D|nr:uncharacterized protein LOC117116792 [Anneissia japonica]
MNMLAFQRKHRTLFKRIVENLKQKTQHSKHCISEIDLQSRLSRLSEWLGKLYNTFRALEYDLKKNDNYDNFQSQNAQTLDMFKSLVNEADRRTKDMVEKETSHVTYIIRQFNIEDDQLIQQLADIEADWFLKHDEVISYTPRNEKSSTAFSIKGRYHRSRMHIYACSSSVIIASPKRNSTENSNTETVLNCYDRNYVDVEFIDTNNRESWMPDKRLMFKMWIYDKDEGKDNPTDYTIGLHSNTFADLGEWKKALMVSEGENGVYDDYRHPIKIVSEAFSSDRKNELCLDVNDTVGILETERSRGEDWTRGKRQKDGKIGWFPSKIVSEEAESDFYRGILIKTRYRQARRQPSATSSSYYYEYY